MPVPTLLAFVAHPDDESYSFGGLIALAARAGWRCLIECASYGEHGERHDGGLSTPNALADTRAMELEASCEALGAAPPTFWGLPDGEMRLHRGEQERIARLMTAQQPSLVLSLGADGAYGHPDHVALYRWVFEAWQSLSEQRSPLLLAAFPRGLFLPQYEKCLEMMGDPPHPPRETIGAGTWDYAVSIASVRAAKLAAIRSHQSQLPGGEPRAIFPAGIIDALLDEERYLDASGQPSAAVRELLGTLSR